MAEVVISKAGPSDEEAIRRVCSACYRDDYILRMIDAFLNTGTVLLASLGEEPVGFVKVGATMDGSGWLSALRVVPSRRREGIGATLSRACEEVAAEAGSRSIRLWTESKNVPAYSLFEALSYRRVASFTRWWTNIAPDAPAPPQRATHTKGSWDRIAESMIFRASKGYFPLALRFCRLSDALLEELMESQVLYLDSAGAPCVLNLEVWKAFDERTVELTVMGDDVRAQVQAATGLGSAIGYGAVGMFLPFGEAWSERAKSAGLARGTWGTHAFLYEKRIAPGGRIADKSR